MENHQVLQELTIDLINAIIDTFDLPPLNNELKNHFIQAAGQQIDESLIPNFIKLLHKHINSDLDNVQTLEDAMQTIQSIFYMSASEHNEQLLHQFYANVYAPAHKRLTNMELYQKRTT
jgi:hypothetical protein